MPCLSINLQTGFNPLVSQGDKINPGQIIARRLSSQEISLNIAEELDVPINKAMQYLKKNPGDSFKEGEILAIRKGFLGSTIAKIVASASGYVTKIERNTGEIFIKPETDSEVVEETIVSPIEGTVSLCNNEKILIECAKNTFVGTLGTSGEHSGEIFVLEHSETVESYQLRAETIGKIVIGKYFSREVLLKGESIGIAAIIGTKILEKDLEYLKSRKVELPVIEIEESTYKSLVKYHNKKAFVSGSLKTIIILDK